jgi:CHAD domain-containing protein
MMAFALHNLAKPPRKLLKLLKGFPANPSPSKVHSLRTQARRLEAVVDVVAPDGDKQAKRILKVITPARKAAGAVRDMDVMIENAFDLSKHDPSGATVRLVEHLAMVREKQARKLHAVIREQGKEMRRRLKRYAKLLQKRSVDDRSGTTENSVAPQILSAELAHWPKFNIKNLHEFRIRAKELHYMLQLSPKPDERGMDALDRVKVIIGDWHDWVELQKTAERVLDSTTDKTVLKQIDSTAKRKSREALASANSLRKRDLGRIVHYAEETQRHSKQRKH